MDAGCACLAHAGTGHVHFATHIRTKTRVVITFHKCKECVRDSITERDEGRNEEGSRVQYVKQ